jgi:hypothetical protein
MQAFITLQKKIDGQHLTGEDRPRFLDAEQQGEFPVPVQGEHDLEPASNPGVWEILGNREQQIIVKEQD